MMSLAEPSSLKIHVVVSSTSPFDLLSIGFSEKEHSTRKSANVGLVKFFVEKNQFDIHLTLIPI